MRQQRWFSWTPGLLCLALVGGVWMVPTVEAGKAGKAVNKKAAGKSTKKSRTNWKTYKKKKNEYVMDLFKVHGVLKAPQRFYFHRTNYKNGSKKLKPKGLLSKVVGAVKSGSF